MRFTAALVTVSTTAVASSTVTALAGVAPHSSRANHTLSPAAKPTPLSVVVVGALSTNMLGLTPDTMNTLSVFDAYFTYSVSPANL